MLPRLRHFAVPLCCLTLLGSALLAGCAGDGDDSSPGIASDDVVVLPGKEDNFIALSAREYLLQGTSFVTLEESYRGKSDEEKLARVKELIPLKNIQIGWFLNVYLSEKKSGDPNAGYGGFHALVREGSYENSAIVADEQDELVYHFQVAFEIGGETSLLEHMPLTHVAGDVYSFTLAMAKVSNSALARLDINSEWYRSYGSWSPEGKAASELENIELTIQPEDLSHDAYFDTNRLFADGKVTIAVHFGWDYHSEYHLKHSESLYDWLLERGYESPVASYDLYTRTSGPLTRTILAGGREIVVEISLFWGKAGTDTDPDTDAGGIVLENDMRESLATREIIAYSGHSGPFYGFALANWKKTEEGDLDDAEIAGLDLPADVYQVVLAEGCDTYGIGEAFWHNPAKADRHDLDVITTTAPSNATTPSAVQDFLSALVGTDGDGNHLVTRVGDLLEDLDDNSYWFNTMYGLHGVDDNPHAHPYAQAAQLCEAGCTDAEDCGGVGNRCVTLTAGRAKVCTFECTADDGCPDGYGCTRIATGGYQQDTFVCTPASGRCE